MQRFIVTLFIAAAMGRPEMRETMQRMVMVRTSGSDLQPEATGYIYKSDGEGPADIVQLDESDVIKHLEAMPALYEQSEAFAAPIPDAAGPFLAEQSEETNEAYVIPVVEINGEDAASVEPFERTSDSSGYQGDFDKLYEGYFGDYTGDYGDGYGYGHESGGGDDYGSEHHSSHGGGESSGYGSKHAYGAGDAGYYGKDHDEGFHKLGGGGKKKHHDEASSYGEHFSSGKSFKSGNHGEKSGHSKGEKTTGFNNIYNKDDFKKDHHFYDDAHNGGKFHKYGDEGSNYGTSDGGFNKGGSHNSGYNHGGFGKHGFHDTGSVDADHHGYSGHLGGDSHTHHQSGFGSKAGEHGGKEYGYEIKH